MELCNDIIISQWCGYFDKFKDVILTHCASKQLYHWFQQNKDYVLRKYLDEKYKGSIDFIESNADSLRMMPSDMDFLHMFELDTEATKSLIRSLLTCCNFTSKDEFLQAFSFVNIKSLESITLFLFVFFDYCKNKKPANHKLCIWTFYLLIQHVQYCMEHKGCLCILDNIELSYTVFNKVKEFCNTINLQYRDLLIEYDTIYDTLSKWTKLNPYYCAPDGTFHHHKSSKKSQQQRQRRPTSSSSPSSCFPVSKVLRVQ